MDREAVIIALVTGDLLQSHGEQLKYFTCAHWAFCEDLFTKFTNYKSLPVCTVPSCCHQLHACAHMQVCLVVLVRELYQAIGSVSPNSGASANPSLFSRWVVRRLYK